MKPAIFGVYPVFFFIAKNNNQKKPTQTHPNATSTSETLGPTLGPTVSLKQTGTSPSLSPTEVRLGTIDFGSASLSGTDVGSNSTRVLVGSFG